MTSVCPLIFPALVCEAMVMLYDGLSVGLADAAGMAPAATRPPAATTGAITRQIFDIRFYFLPAGRAP